MLGFTTAAREYDGGSIGAISSVANGAGIDLSATFQPHAAGDKVGAADAAHDQAAAKLEQARDARFAISGALEQKQDGGRSGHGMAAGKPSLKAELLAGAAGAAIFAVNPTAGVAYMAAGALTGAALFVQNAMSMGGDGAVGAHAGVEHAAVNPGRSAFGSLTRERKNDPILSGYTDSMGFSWGEGGLPVTNQPVQQSPRPGHAINPRMQAAADIVVDQLGEEKIREQLSGASYAEHRLRQQAAAAREDWNFKSTRRIEAPSLG